MQAHEWEKHGTCAEELFAREADFFNATLHLNAAANLEAGTPVSCPVPCLVPGHVLACA